jgi:acyl carrier protein
VDDGVRSMVMARLTRLAAGSAPSITDSSELEGIGIDSLALLELFVDIEIDLDIKIPLELMTPSAYKTVSDVVRLVHEVKEER